mmetsp:Transcript_4830/g.7312  ORF Transcript_4830/g.7312 Transcript_4830/m.7312 type:complete len:204 (-) Transcript_4830:998-1609(-)
MKDSSCTYQYTIHIFIHFCPKAIINQRPFCIRLHTTSFLNNNTPSSMIPDPFMIFLLWQSGNELRSTSRYNTVLNLAIHTTREQNLTIVIQSSMNLFGNGSHFPLWISVLLHPYAKSSFLQWKLTFTVVVVVVVLGNIYPLCSHRITIIATGRIQRQLKTPPAPTRHKNTTAFLSHFTIESMFMFIFPFILAPSIILIIFISG